MAYSHVSSTEGYRAAARLAAAGLMALLAVASPARAQGDEALGFERTPPRLSFVDGVVSFLRPGADEWTPARVNIALAAGDELYAAADSNLELQVGPRAYVRAGANTDLGLASLEPDFLQLRVDSGVVSLDLRSLTAGQTFEIDTPQGAFTVERTGYYRVEVDGNTTTLVTRRGGRAVLTPAAGPSLAIASSEQVVVSGTDAPRIESYAAPEIDAWDRWNYARTDAQLDALSARYVPSGVYGAADLDLYGDWRVVPTYGPVWVPRGVPAGWVPYSTGRWMYGPYYGWTWVDDAPWGWAPYHYGRWVHVSGFWGWCPGPIVARAYYAPALVAFYGGGGFSIGIRIGSPSIGWVALGWGEPLVPWWGPPTFRHKPHWAGWGGPRVVNGAVVTHQTVIQVSKIDVYRNARQPGAIVVESRDRFGRRSGGEAHFGRADAAKTKKLAPVHGELPVKPARTSLIAASGPAPRPPRDVERRPVVATRAPRATGVPGLEPRPTPSAATRGERGTATRTPEVRPPAHVVRPPQAVRGGAGVSERPPFARGGEVERRAPSAPPRLRDVERAAPEPAARPATPPGGRGQPPATGRAPATRPAPPPAAGRSELPGEPANRVYPRGSRGGERSGAGGGDRGSTRGGDQGGDRGGAQSGDRGGAPGADRGPSSGRRESTQPGKAGGGRGTPGPRTRSPQR